MAKGAEAKDYILSKLQETFGEDFLGESNKKYYVLAPEDGSKIQIAISLTCPKTEATDFSTPVIAVKGGAAASKKTCAWDIGPTEPQVEVELTNEEIANIEKLKKEFNL